MYKFISLILILFLYGCSESSSYNKTESFGEVKSEGEIVTCACSELVENELKELLKDGKLFTGHCYINYNDSEVKYIEKQILNGVLNGTIRYFNKLGDIIFEEKYEQGNHQIDLQVENIRCNCKTLKKDRNSNQFKYKGQIFRGVCFSNFPDTEQAYIEITYDKGVRNGFTTYFNKYGHILYTEKYASDSIIQLYYPTK